LRRIGYGLAALYRVVPLQPRPGSSTIEVVSAAFLADEVLKTLAERIGFPVEPQLGPSLDIRLGLAVAAREAWPAGIAGGLGGMDGMELAAVYSEEDLAPRLAAIRDRSIEAGMSPIESLLASKEISPSRGARLRARSLGIEMAAASEMQSLEDEAWLPPGLTRRGDLDLVSLREGSIIVASSHPTARLAREVSTLFPDVAIAWRVSSAAEFTQEPTELADGVSGEHSALGAPGGP